MEGKKSGKKPDFIESCPIKCAFGWYEKAPEDRQNSLAACSAPSADPLCPCHVRAAVAV